MEDGLGVLAVSKSFLLAPTGLPVIAETFLHWCKKAIEAVFRKKSVKKGGNTA